MNTAAETPPESTTPASESVPAVMLAFLREMNEQRQETRQQRIDYQQATDAARKERQTEHKWRIIFQSLIFGVPAVMAVAYFLVFLFSAGFRFGPFGDVVGVVKVSGPIAAHSAASAEAVIPALQKAFESNNVKTVLLSIDSPGGAPVEAERIYTAIADLKTRYKKPVVAVINNLGASAGYMIAVHADIIVAGKYSMVGSIGAIMETLNYADLLKRLDVKDRVFASGPYKNFLNPATPPDAKVDAMAQLLVDTLAGTFESEVRGRRGTRLKNGIAIATGAIWTGEQALAIGLVDHVGTLEGYVTEKLGGLKVHDFGPDKPQSLAAMLRGALSALLPPFTAPTIGDSIPTLR